jgi:hypothetical protein
MMRGKFTPSWKKLRLRDKFTVGIEALGSQLDEGEIISHWKESER